MRSWSGLSFSLFLRSMRNSRTGPSRGWYRHFLSLPLRAKDYLRWRMYTAYGDETFVPPADDVLKCARWAVRDR